MTQDLVDRKVHIDGATAILTETDNYTYAENRHVSTGSLRLTATYLDRGNRWVAIAEQMNALRSKPDLSAAEATIRKLDAEWAQTSSVDTSVDYRPLRLRVCNNLNEGLCNACKTPCLITAYEFQDSTPVRIRQQPDPANLRRRPIPSVAHLHHNAKLFSFSHTCSVFHPSDPKCGCKQSPHPHALALVSRPKFHPLSLVEQICRIFLRAAALELRQRLL